MTFLPIVERELRVAARLSSTYRNRSLIAGGVAVVAFFSLMFGSIGLSRYSVGAGTFKMLAAVVLMFCVVEGARKTADCLSEEKREGTIGLLFLTDLKGYDIVLGKLVGTSLTSVYGLISILPVLALPLLLGGVLAVEFWRAALALLNLLFLSLCLGILISSISRNEQKAMAMTVLIMAVLCILPWLPVLFAIRPINPAYAFNASFEAYYRADRAGYWESLGAGQMLSWSLLIGACLILPRAWQERAVDAPGWVRWRQRLKQWPRYAKMEARRRREMLALNPIVWLSARQSGVRFGLYSIAAVAAIAAAGFCLSGGFGSQYYAGACWALNLMVKIWLGVQAARCMAEGRRNNTLEMLLVTPLKTNQIISGSVDGLVRLFLPPVLVILGIEAIGYALGMVLRANAIGLSSGDEISAAVILGAGYLVLFALDATALLWTGLWFGLTSKKDSQAIAKTVLLVLGLPYLSMICWCPGMFLFFLSSALWTAWARGRMQSQFRQKATQTESFQRQDTPLLVVPPFNRQQPPLPPIING
ncbi:MAG TPA: hypothetical protein VFC07_12915 [Verrucomicrobiae bacterium]|nr:hypothetical protein [Verrucomicrobiae bacterium]